jgi:hypothetical protein
MRLSAPSWARSGMQANTCRLQRCQLPRQCEAVSGETNCIHPRQTPQRGGQLHKISPQSGLTACQPNLVHARACKYSRLPDTRAGSVELQATKCVTVLNRMLVR